MGSTAVTIEHDEEWTAYPEVGPMGKQMTGEENCFAVAICMQHQVWGVGFAAGKKGREAAAKLALAISIASANPSLEAKIRNSYPEYSSIQSNDAAAAGACMGMMGGAANRKRKAGEMAG